MNDWTAIGMAMFVVGWVVGVVGMLVHLLLWGLGVVEMMGVTWWVALTGLLVTNVSIVAALVAGETRPRPR